jgi:hypothetical protein
MGQFVSEYRAYRSEPIGGISSVTAAPKLAASKCKLITGINKTNYRVAHPALK